LWLSAGIDLVRAVLAAVEHDLWVAQSVLVEMEGQPRHCSAASVH
jgi:hypothetical protein